MNRSSISALFSILLLSCGGKLTTSAVSTSKQNDSSSSSSSRKLQNNNVINNWSNKEQGLANLLFEKIEASKTSSPTVSPTTAQPTESPTLSPSSSPSDFPSVSPTDIPSVSPSSSPTISTQPSISPTAVPSVSPSIAPTVSAYPTSSPSVSPSNTPTNAPSVSQMPTIYPSLHPSESPTATPSFPPSISTYPTISSSTQPSQYPTSEEALLPPLTDSVIIEHASSDSNTTPILIVGAACFLVLASTTAYLHRKGNESSSSGSGKQCGSSRGGEKSQQSHDHHHGGGLVSPVSIDVQDNGFTKGLSGTFDGVTFSKSEETIDYDYNGNKHTTTNIVQEENDMVDVDLEAGRGERGHTSSCVPNSVAFNVDEQCDIELSNTYDWSVMSSSVLARMPTIYIPKLFQRSASSTAKNNEETTTNKKKLPTWNEIREEGIGQSSSGSSGFAPTSPVISPFKVRGLSSMLSPYGSKKRGIALVNEEDEDVFSVSLGNNVATTTTSTKSITRKSAWTRKGGMMALVDEDMESSVRGGEANRSRRAAWSSKKRSMMMMKSPVKEITIEMESPSPDIFTNLEEDPVDDDERKIQKTSSSNSNGSSIEWGIDVSNIKPADKATFDQNMNELQNILVSIKSLGSDEEEFSKRVDDRASPKSEVPLTYTQDSWEQSNGGNDSIEQNSKSDRSAYLVNMDPIESASIHSSSMRSRSFPPSSPHHQEVKATNEQQDESGITFQRELLKSNNHESNMTFSFRNIFQDPKNDLYECRAPSGPLGIVVDTTPLGPRVRSLNPLSPIFGKVSPGDVIVGVDDVDTVGMEAGDFWKIASRKANQQTRTLTILRI